MVFRVPSQLEACSRAVEAGNYTACELQGLSPGSNDPHPSILASRYPPYGASLHFIIVD